MKTLLLIAFKYPPYAGVGAFRWAQLSYYLALQGYTIHVVTVHWEERGPNTLSHLTDHPNIHIHRIRSGGLHNFKTRDLGCRIANGVRNKIFVHGIDKYFFPFDDAQRWGKHLIPYCKQLIKKFNINAVVATGHPFMANYYAARLKQETSGIVLIQDLRDLWAEDLSISLDDAARKRMAKLERYALLHADMNVTVTEGCKQKFLETCPEAQFSVILNGYDAHALVAPANHECRHNAQEKLAVYLGSVSSGREECCEALFSALRNNDIPLKVAIAGQLPSYFFEKYAQLFAQEKVVFAGTLAYGQAIELLYQSDICLHFTARHVPQALSTKIFEYAAAEKPILSINWGGDAERLIAVNRWGDSICPDDACFDDKIKAFLNQGMQQTHFDISVIEQYSYARLAKTYANLIESLTS